MEDRLIIKEVFLKFVDIMESDEIDKLKDILTEDVVLEATNYGYATGLDNVKKKLKWQGLLINFSRNRIFNFVAFTENGFAKQSAVVASLVGQNDENYFHYFNFSGYYCNDYVKAGEQWKISHIRYNLDLEHGNTLFVRNWWTMIDYRFYKGTSFFPIVSEIDAPWRAIKNPEFLGTEEEQVVDAYYRYCWGIDHSDMDILLSSLDEKVKLEKSAVHLPIDMNPDEESDHKDFVRIMKYKRFKEAVVEHIFKIDKIEIKGDKAFLRTFKFDPHRIGTNTFCKKNMNDDFYDVIGEYEFVKKKGSDWRTGGWKMVSNKPTLKFFTVSTYDKNKFYGI